MKKSIRNITFFVSIEKSKIEKRTVQNTFSLLFEFNFFFHISTMNQNKNNYNRKFQILYCSFFLDQI